MALWTASCRVMKQALAAVIPIPENNRNGARDGPLSMKNGINEGTRLEAVCPGDILTLRHSRFRVLTSQRDHVLVTLELDDAPEHPLTLIGLPGMAVSIEPRHDGGAAPEDPTANSRRNASA